MPVDVILHIGTHKTGSTTVQSFLQANRRRLSEYQIDFFQGSFIPENHIELYLSCIERDRDTLAQQTMDIGSLDALFERTSRQVAEFIAQSSGNTVIFSTEGLSLLRSRVELARLVQMFDPKVHRVRVVCVLRDKSGYLDAYRKQILKVPGRKASDNPRSALYVEPDSWLVDYDQLLASYRQAFGDASVLTVDYNHEVDQVGDVLPAVLRQMTLPDALIPEAGGYKRANTRSVKNRLKQSLYRIYRTLTPRRK